MGCHAASNIILRICTAAGEVEIPGKTGNVELGNFVCSDINFRHLGRWNLTQIPGFDHMAKAAIGVKNLQNQTKTLQLTDPVVLSPSLDHGHPKPRKPTVKWRRGFKTVG